MGRCVRNCQLVYTLKQLKMCVIAIRYRRGGGGPLPTPYEYSMILANANNYYLVLIESLKNIIECLCESQRTSLNANVID
jgi:hypothetical protein